MRPAVPRLALLLAAVLLLPSVRRALAADAAPPPCTIIYVEPLAARLSNARGLTAANLNAITKSVADGLRPTVPRARILLLQDMRAAVERTMRQLQQSSTDALAGRPPEFDQLNAAQVVVNWWVGTLGDRTLLFVQVLSYGRAQSLFRGDAVVPAATEAAFSQAANRLAHEAGEKIAGQYYCLALSEHHVTIDYNNPGERQHAFQAQVTDLAGRPQSGRNVLFVLASPGAGTISPESGNTRSGSVRTVFRAQQRSDNQLTATMTSRYQDELRDQATITIVDRRLHVHARRRIDIAKFCAGTEQGVLGPLALLMQTFLKPFLALPGEQMTCTGESTEDDDIMIPRLEKTASGYTGTAHWQSTLTLPAFTLASSQFTAQATTQPRTLIFDATVTATPVDGDPHHLEVVVRRFVQGVPTSGGAITGTVHFAENGAVGMLQQLDKALLGAGLAPPGGLPPDAQRALQNPAPITVPPDQPMNGLFNLELPLPLPAAAHASAPLSFEGDGRDEIGPYHYKVDGEIDLGGSPRR